MTGNEALIYVSKGLSALAFEEGKWNISERDNEALQALKEIVQKYDKYERAFEILGNHMFVPFGLFNERTGEINYYFGTNFSKHKLTKEEYELLEELVKELGN